MRLSGFDKIYLDIIEKENFLWGGYSAGICVLCDSLNYIEFVDDPYDFPYIGSNEIIWEGLKRFDFGLLPHFESDHEDRRQSIWKYKDVLSTNGYLRS